MAQHNNTKFTAPVEATRFIGDVDGTEIQNIQASNIVGLTIPKGGLEFTGGFTDRTTGTAGVSDAGSNVAYTQQMVTDKRWMRFGIDATAQAANDVPYWTDPTPASSTGIGLFGGSQMPNGVTSLFDYTYNGDYSLARDTGTKFTAATGSYDFTQCQMGDFLIARFDFNIVPQVANTTVEVGLIWQTRNSANEETFTFALTAQPQFYGVGTVGNTFLSRPLITAYFASNEDLNARALPAIRADNPVEIQPLTTLVTIQR